MQAPVPPRPTRPNHARRLAWLLACVFAGWLVGATGSTLSGSTAWYLAIPAAVAIGWLFLADPTECEPHSHDTNQNQSR